VNQWREVVVKMVALPREAFLTCPLAANAVTPPSGSNWPDGLPVSQALRSFYGLCDGGTFGNCAFNVCGIGELASWTTKGIELLRDYDSRGDILLPGRHLVFGTDAEGAPLIWDAVTDHVATFFWKGGDWEPIADSAEAFLHGLFNPDPEEEPDWAQSVDAILAA
jgi:hypothetical protein